jgi:hypothetical protein
MPGGGSHGNCHDCHNNGDDDGERAGVANISRRTLQWTGRLLRDSMRREGVGTNEFLPDRRPVQVDGDDVGPEREEDGERPHRRGGTEKHDILWCGACMCTNTC